MLLVIQSFFEGQSATWDVAKKEQNRTKNRYGNIIACEPVHIFWVQKWILRNLYVSRRKKKKRGPSRNRTRNNIGAF